MKLHFPSSPAGGRCPWRQRACFAQAADVTIAYQTTVDPAKVAQADGAYEKATKADIELAQIR